jgi:hypothetical protein
MKKPIQLRLIFIMNALMMILPFVFYFVITSKNIDLNGLDPVIMIYTGIAYIASFAVLVKSILDKNMMLFRVMFGINLLIALPAKAYIGIAVVLLSILISFNAKVKAYFAS